ncbi:saccharopine dehydrogenase [Phialemonium atrogriseum]|uniref:Saccharopine dehydrogenase [NAD(+), L-lysine-forming] n=1 Tax=Phialemonium atrogriseum TaxID=1093897 RepID=A0AAJ0C4N8_9PEZI|nr:saccharopine dehydrogenase [Phialemonium atrogriseum]KAK1767616.1 saccharopine dehydrogenase [Phialemonium atrogriseum]
MANNVVLHFRAEAAPLGYLAILTPESTRQLVEAGMKVHVERSTVRCFADQEYEAVGAKLVPPDSWPDAPIDHIILGIKEPENLKDIQALKHTHIYSGYYYKQQKNSVEGLQRYIRGGGTFLDLGSTKHGIGNQTDVFGRFTGIGGFAAALKAWRHQLEHPDGVTPMQPVKIHDSLESLVQEAKANLDKGIEITGRYPRVAIVGPAGRTGSGCLSLCRAVGIPENNILKWGREETSRPGPRDDLLQSDILVNCLYTNRRINPLIDDQALKRPRKLSIIVDISCDYQGPYHALPIYWQPSHFDNLAMPVSVPFGPPLTVVACNYYAAMVPRDTSEYATKALLPFFTSLIGWKQGETWRKLERLFWVKSDAIPQSERLAKL